MGVYRITDTVDGTCYVGASRTVELRLTQHRSSLRRGDHRNSKLQQAWKRDGENAFTFCLVEAVTEPNTLEERERAHVELAGAMCVSRLGQVGKGVKPMAGGDGAYIELGVASARFGVSVNTLHMWRGRGYLTRYKRGRMIVVDAAEVARRVEQRNQVRRED